MYLEDTRDKTKEYIKEYDDFVIITFWKPEIKNSIQAGWVHRVEDKKTKGVNNLVKKDKNNFFV